MSNKKFTDVEKTTLNQLIEDVRSGKYDGQRCFVKRETDNETVMVNANEKGYWTLSGIHYTDEEIIKHNLEKFGISELLAEAFHVVSMFPKDITKHKIIITRISQEIIEVEAINSTEAIKLAPTNDNYNSKQIVKILNEEKFPRYCEHCGIGFTSGICIAAGMAYYCSTDCLAAEHTPEEIIEMGIGDDDSDSYYSEWELEEDEDLNHEPPCKTINLTERSEK